MLPRIFIVGTGRSGTWILNNILGSHRAIHTFPAEMRFLIDPGGLLDLMDALTHQYSPARAREALFQFERLMRVYLATPNTSPYSELDFPSWLGGEQYWRRLDRFCDSLTEVIYQGWSWDIEYENEGLLVALARRLQERQVRLRDRPVVPKVTLPRTWLKEGRFFADRTDLAALASSFVDDLFLGAAHAHQKETWCEKTPQHLLHIDFLQELFPNAIFIHIKRDPRGVVHSLTKQPWAPNDVRAACLYAKGMYARWSVLRPTLNLGPKCYLEIKLEDLAAATEAVMAKVMAFCGVECAFNDFPDVEMAKTNGWQQSMRSEDIQLVNELLSPYIEEWGYEI